MRYRPHERPTLNERPIYLHSFHMFLACVQAVFHLYYDYDRIAVPIADKKYKTDDERIHRVPPTSNVSTRCSGARISRRGVSEASLLLERLS
jgi:Nucleoporin protein Ndc1-Nup.